MAVASVLAAYYAVFFLPPRQLGRVDPDRFYHLGLSALTAGHGFLRTLPQVDDLGWGRYFPDKEFLFHLLTGLAYQLGGPAGVLLLVPMLGIAIALVVYGCCARAVRPSTAATLVLAGLLLTGAYMFRLTLLRPHMLSILCFVWLVAALLGGRRRQAALASAGFALSYHAFYVAGLVAVLGWLFRRRIEGAGPAAGWALAGLLFGVVLNPYFPSNLVMSLFHVEVALGIDQPPGGPVAVEVLSLPWRNFFLLYGFVPAGLVMAGLGVLVARRGRLDAGDARFWFLFSLSAMLALLAVRSARATEYAIPVSLMTVAFGASIVRHRGWIAANLAVLIALQGYSATLYYTQSWLRPEQGPSALYAAALASIPVVPASGKVFNCEWEAGAYVLFFRPDLRFVDLLDPGFLWRTSRAKYLARIELIRGRSAAPEKVLDRMFDADYVLCAAPALNRQLDLRPGLFTPLFGRPGDDLRVFSLQRQARPVDELSARPRTD